LAAGSRFLIRYDAEVACMWITDMPCATTSWDTSCGVRVCGNDGDALTYHSWTYSTEDNSRHVAIALTPGHDRDPEQAVDEFLDRALCG
jgi:hypothetical protein